MNESTIPETVKTPAWNRYQAWFTQDLHKWNDTCLMKLSKQIMQRLETDSWHPHIPPIMAHTLVRKCKNETCSSVKVTWNMKFQYITRSRSMKENVKTKKNYWKKTVNKSLVATCNCLSRKIAPPWLEKGHRRRKLQVGTAVGPHPLSWSVL